MDKKKALTQKQEKAAQHFVEHGNKSDAYRHAYSTKNFTAKSVNEKASQLFSVVKVKSRVEELQAATLKRHEITVDSLAAEYEEAKQLALKIERPEAAIKAIDGKARITGHDKKVIDLRSTDGSMSPTGINWIEDEGGE
jgi:phage terminase small subunit